MSLSRLLERLAAQVGLAHARRVYAAFTKAQQNVPDTQQRVWSKLRPWLAAGAYGRSLRLAEARLSADLRKAAPLVRYDDLRPWIERVADGDVAALFPPRAPVLMFASSSGTTSAPKLIPVTRPFIAEYRRGWNTFGLKLLLDHPAAILRHILQSSGRHDESRARGGAPIGAITGLIATMQKGIVRRYYVGPPALAQVADTRAKHYALMRLGVTRDVSFAITANPATLIRMAQTANEESEALIRDVRDGALSAALLPDAALRRELSLGLRPDPPRAAALEQLRQRHGRLAPLDYWRMEFLACWTGGSMGHYLPRVADWYGPLPVRDVGLLASEGRVSLPLEDGSPRGVLDTQGAIFEFIPIAQADSPDPDILTPDELQSGHDYIVVLTNSAGLIRYRLDDVVRVHGRFGAAPVVEFLYRAGRVASLAGEKLTENQVVAAVQALAASAGWACHDFLLAPIWNDPPCYRVITAASPPPGWLTALDQELGRQNGEYRARRESQRLGPLQPAAAPPDFFVELDRKLIARRGGANEQHKRPCLLIRPDELDSVLRVESAPAPCP